MNKKDIQPTLTLMTCGTSLITNGIDSELRSIINRCANAVNWTDISSSDAAILKSHFKEKEKQFLASNEQEIRRLSAELNGLLAWQEENPVANSQLQNEYWIIATDTILGKTTAEIIQEWLGSHGYHTQILSESGLRTANLIEFRQALSALTKRIVESVTGYRNGGYQINFNLTGGFKGINGFLQALATVYANQTYYLFEGSTELLYIPQLPYRLDATQIITENLTAFRRLANGMSISQAQSSTIPDIWLFDIDSSTMLSEWGELIWLDTMPKLYQQQVLPSPSDLVIYSPSFLDTIKKADASLIEIINKRIDALAVYAEGGYKQMLKSLDVKALQANQYRDKGILECDLDAHHRLFMTRDGEHITILELHAALH
ncbi:putative CRISPR-associated protein [Psychrobacter sp. Ps2]|uniref:putative CRISPR-associated protein n=1 Tax=Psychrobacter sp. Ps2 TaxID=2790956 RepID=UPI001EDD7F54|nr:putative CRISPR-associated protein [Psychrobacter sp. Ps2]MCG3858847.1 putative CRISPR-associated protein [Psychrobacter sp. Ps2]